MGRPASRLHVRLVLLFSGVAVAPTIFVACFAVAFFHFGIQAWFNDPVRSALDESLQVSRGYLEEHRNNIRAVALEMANDLMRAGQLLAGDPSAFGEVLAHADALRGLTEAVIYDPLTGPGDGRGRVVCRPGRRAAAALARYRAGAQAATSWCWTAGDATRVRAVVRLEFARRR